MKTARVYLVERLASTLQVVNECDSGGIGPHEFAWLADGKTLAVANGGILTHPDKPRIKLNIDSMAPNLAIIDFDAKKVLERVPGKEPKASIRHLAIADNDLVIVGMQYEGSPLNKVPLVATYSGSGWDSIEMPDEDLAKMKQYTGSVCVDPTTGYALVTSPRGHQLTFWNTREQQYLGKKHYRDISGLAFDSSSQCFFATTGLGKAYTVSIDSFLELNEQKLLSKQPNLKWDNHVTRV